MPKAMQFKTSRYLAAALVVVFFSLVIFLYVAWNSRLLRPASDDYCYSSVAGKGLFPAIAHWLNHWSGDATAIISNTVFVGLPVVHLPWGLTSSVTFLAAVLSVAIAALVLLSPLLKRGPRSRAWMLVLTASVLPMSWWTYWWVPVALGSGEQSQALARSITLWQNINSAYVITTALLLTGYVLVVWRGQAAARARVIAATAIGLVVGLAGPVLATSVIAAIVAVIGLRWLEYSRFPRLRVHAMLAGGVILGVVLSYLAPGTRARSVEQGTSIDPSFASLYQWVFPTAINDWWNLVFNPGALVTAVVVSATTALMARHGMAIDRQRAVIVAGALLLSSLVMAFVNRASEAFIYQAYWHRVPIGVLIFLGLVALAFGIGQWIADRSALFSVAVVVLVAVALPLATLAVGVMVADIRDRYEHWTVGPAPLSTIADIEEGSGWVKCWFDLGNYRGLPDRIPDGMTIPVEAPIPS